MRDAHGRLIATSISGKALLVFGGGWGGALGTQVKLGDNLPSKGLGTPAARGKEPEADTRSANRRSPRRQSAPASVGEGGGERRRPKLRRTTLEEA